MFVLYTTSGCHLCDQAMALMHQAIVGNGFAPMELDLIDISEDEMLFEQFGERIPVLENTDNGARLYWPFNENEFLVFLSHSH